MGATTICIGEGAKVLGAIKKMAETETKCEETEAEVNRVCVGVEWGEGGD